jgi:ligand-binding sensor domain-containing protein
VPIAGDYVVAVLVDREGRIWSGTNDGGVTRIDPGGSKTFRHDASNPRSISADAAFEIVEDAQGTVWLGTADGLDRWDAETGGFVRTPVRGDNVVAIVPQASGRLWVGTFGGGLQEFDPKDGQIRVQLSDPLRRDALGSASRRFWEDATGRCGSGAGGAVSSASLPRPSSWPPPRSGRDSRAGCAAPTSARCARRGTGASGWERSTASS